MYFGWWVVTGSFLISFFVAGSTVYGFTAFFEPLIAEFGWSYTQVSFAGSLRGVEMGIFAPLVGILVDRVDPGRIILVGTFLVGLGLIILSQTNSLSSFYVGYIIVAFGSAGCTTVVLMSAVTSWFKKHAGKALGITASGFGAAGLLVPLIVWMIEAWQWRSTFLVLGLGMWGLGIPLSIIIRNPSANARSKDKHTFVAADKSKSVFRTGRLSFGQAIRKKSFWLVNIGDTFRMATLMAVVTHIIPYLSSVGISRASAGFVASSVPIFSVIGRFGLGWLCDRYSKKAVLVLAFSLMMGGVLAFSYAHLYWPLLIFMIMFPIGYGGGISVRTIILRDYFGQAIFGKILGVVMGTAAIGGIFGPLAGGWTFDHFGNYHIIWLFFTALIFIGLILALNLKALSTVQENLP